MQGKWGAPICRIGWLEHARRKATIMGGRPSGGLEMQKLTLTTELSWPASLPVTRAACIAPARAL
jgi:hypothetical protein